jgi:hypothetical protein
MNIGGIQHKHAIYHAPVAPTTADKQTTDPFADTAAASAVPATASNNSAQTGTTDQSAYNESFARMMVNLQSTKAPAANSDSDADANSDPVGSVVKAADQSMKGLATAIPVGNAAGSSDSGSTDSTDTSGLTGAAKEFMDYMSQSPMERLRESITGLSKEDYDKLSPEDKAKVDKKVEDAMKAQMNAKSSDPATQTSAVA